VTTDYLTLAKTIRANATQLLDAKQIDVTIKKMGQLFYTGSYALDLMTWNDIDMQVVLKDGVDAVQALGTFFTFISQDRDFIEAQMINFTGNYKPKMPRGVYIGVKLNSPQFGGEWKLDLWALTKEDFKKNQKLLDLLQSKLTQARQKEILAYKHEMMVKNGRVPQMGSHMLYQALLIEEIEGRDALFDYLIKQGIDVAR
jgi:hypothetical protein